MTIRKLGGWVLCVMMTLVVPLAGGVAVAADSKPMKPEVAAKVENHRKQSEQRITDQKRKTAVDALKAERLKVYKAKQHVKKSKQGIHDAKDLSAQ